MKKIIVGTFDSAVEAEKLIDHLHRDLGVLEEDISYTYRDQSGDVKEVSSDEVIQETPAEGAKSGAVIGGTVGALAGIATVAGVIPVIGPIFAAGSLVTMIGLGAGAVGTTAAGALTGALAGGLIGALTKLGAPETDIKALEQRIMAGEILLVVYAQDKIEEIREAFREANASEVYMYTPTL
jgi:uncharacterized membrane protein